jgi:lysozyme family protein
MIDNFIDDILKKEGGFQNSSSDNGNWTGGKTGKGTLVGTNLGITAPTLAKWRGVPASSITEADIKNVTAAEAKDIYEKKYYIDTKINLLPQNIQANVLDMAINAGPSRAIKLLQKSAGVTADGKLGPKTLEAVKTVDNNSYVDARNNFYTGLVKQNPEKYSKFEKGWVNRSNSFKETAPEDPYQLPSPYERRMQFAQQDPRRVDLAQQMAKAPQAPQETQYASMEDLLADRDLMGRSLFT